MYVKIQVELRKGDILLLKKKYFTLIASFIGLLTIFASPTLAATTYTDVPSTYRSHDEIIYLAKGDITTSGSSSSKYSPEAPMTRAHAAVMIGKSLQLSGTNKTVKFSDVPSTHIYAGYINEAANRGIITGYAGGKFEPNETLTRGEMAVLIARAFGYDATSTNAAANELMSKGIAAGVGKGNFGTTQLMKRGDFAVFLARAVNAEFRTKTITDTSTKMYVNTNDLNFRPGPGMGYKETAQFFSEYPVAVYYSVGNWVFAKANGSYGFFSKELLTTNAPAIGSTPTAPVVVAPVKPVKPTSSLSNLKIVIDPGHGGSDPGAIGLGVKEKDVVLDIGLRMKKYFNQTPMTPILTREKDVFITLSNRGAFAAKNNADSFVSIHANALNGSAQGQETFYYSAVNQNTTQSKALATYIQERMQEAWGLRDRGVKPGNYAVLRQNSVPAALAEIGFIDNKTDNAYIASSTRKEQMAKAIFLGVLDYYYHYEGYSDVASLYSQFGTTASKKHY